MFMGSYRMPGAVLNTYVWCVLYTSELQFEVAVNSNFLMRNLRFREVQYFIQGHIAIKRQS
jgi:hypothetical protein